MAVGCYNSQMRSIVVAVSFFLLLGLTNLASAYYYDDSVIIEIGDGTPPEPSTPPGGDSPPESGGSGSGESGVDGTSTQGGNGTGGQGSSGNPDGSSGISVGAGNNSSGEGGVPRRIILEVQLPTRCLIYW